MFLCTPLILTYCYQGDNDPLDVVELGSSPLQIGDVLPVRVLGALCLIDQEELDWKVLCVRSTENLTISELESSGRLKAIREWFKSIKVYDGKKPNSFAFEERVLSVERTLQVIEENHHHYRKLIEGETKNTEGFWLR